MSVALARMGGTEVGATHGWTIQSAFWGFSENIQSLSEIFVNFHCAVDGRYTADEKCCDRPHQARRGFEEAKDIHSEIPDF
jgi:hypothetical protein